MNNTLTFFEKLDILDQVIKQGPTHEAINKLLNLLNDKMLYRYFFETIDTPLWIKPLKEAGFFSNPPEKIKKKDFVEFPSWPESQFLERVASKDPEEVCKIILKIPDTNNPRVHEDFIEAALNIPPDLSVQIFEKEKKMDKKAA